MAGYANLTNIYHRWIIDTKYRHVMEHAQRSLGTKIKYWILYVQMDRDGMFL